MGPLYAHRQSVRLKEEEEEKTKQKQKHHKQCTSHDHINYRKQADI
jgi:hypothetical protein